MTGMKKRLLSFLFPLVAFLVVDVASARGLRDVFPLGVYWAWPHNGNNAEAAGLSVDDYLDRSMATLKSLNCDAIWVVNGPYDESAKFLDLCGRHGIGAVLDGNAVALKTDTMHVEALAGMKGGDAALDAPRVRLKTESGMPTRLPVGATGLEFVFDAPDACLREIYMWFTSK